jgi:two-component system response regulator LytT
MYRIVICDDDPQLCASLQDYLEKMGRESGQSWRISVFYSGEELLAAWSDDTDILLLDIQMGAVSGMDVARQLRTKSKHVCIIFITAMTQYAVEGYEVHAFGFLKKPVGYERFRHVMEEALHVAAARADRVFSLRRGAEIKQISAGEILYIEACGHEIRVVTEKETLLAGSSLSEFEEQLQGRGFFRCHKGYLIHFAYIKKIDQRSVTMTNGEEIPLSKHRRREFLESFAKFAGVRL